MFVNQQKKGEKKTKEITRFDYKESKNSLFDSKP